MQTPNAPRRQAIPCIRLSGTIKYSSVIVGRLSLRRGEVEGEGGLRAGSDSADPLTFILSPYCKGRGDRDALSVAGIRR
jgi:hypothetical protein